MITGMYRDRSWHVVEMRSLWEHRDLLRRATWLDPEGALQQTTLVRDEIEEAIRLGHLVRDHRRNS